MLTSNDIQWINENVVMPNVNGNVNGTCKQRVNTELTQSKLLVNNMLTAFNYRTPPKEIAIFLEKVFNDPYVQEGHWLYIAQHYNPRTIYRVLEVIMKQQERGDKSIKNIPAYFTYLIKRRKRRRKI